MSSSVAQTPGVRFINASDAKPEILLIYNPTTGDYDLATSSDGLQNVANFVWNTGTLSWDKMTQPGGGGGGGGAVTIADGADVAEGATTDAAVITDTNGTISGKLRGLVKWAYERMPVSLGQKLMVSSFPVVIASDQSTIKVLPSDGTNDNTFKPLNVQVVGTDVGLVTNAVIHGLTTAGGGSYVDVKVNPSGALTVDATQSGAWSTGRTWDLSFAADQVDVSGSTVAAVISDGGGSITVDQPVVDLVGNAPATNSVGVASALALAANANRKGAAFCNLSNANISFGLDGSAAVLGSGITLTPFGTWVMDDYTFTTGAIAAIASAAASSLSIQEFQ